MSIVAPNPLHQPVLANAYEVTDVSADPSDLPLGAVASLSPDALMAYCQSRLDSIDGQVRASFTKQQNTNAEQSLIGEALQALQVNASGTNGTSNPAVCQAMELKLEDVINQIKAIDPHCPELAKLERVHDDLMSTGTGRFTDANGVGHGYLIGPSDHKDEDSNIDGTEMQGFIGALTSINADLNSGAELQMITLQSLMAQRQTAIQLTTNLVQSLGDQLNKIADNIGH